MTKRPRCNLRIERWKRAIELAKILFDDQGYYSLYLDGLLAFAVAAAADRDIGDGPDPSSHKTPTHRRNPRCT